MILHFSYSMAPLKITCLCQECRIHSKTHCFSMLFAWSPVVSRRNTVAPLYGVSQTQWAPCMALCILFLRQADLREYNILEHGIGTQWSPCIVFPKHSGLLVW